MEKNVQSKRTRSKRERQLLIMSIAWTVFGVICIISIVSIVYVFSQGFERGKPLDTEELVFETMFEPGKMSEMVQDNHMKYLKKAYIFMGGTYPDCELIKIRADVDRNNYDENGFFTAEGEKYRNYYAENEKQGRVAIDVSNYQQSIDWNKVKADGVDVAIVRLGYRGYGEAGSLNLDDNFTKNLSGASNAGLDTGVYFFTEAKNYDEGVKEAQYVLQNIAGYSVTETVVIDTEYIEGVDARANEISNTDRTDAIIGFCETIKAAGYTPMIYASRNWFILNLEIERLNDYEWWLAHYTDSTDFPYQFTAWQYSSEGDVAGISEKVDMNIWMR